MKKFLKWTGLALLAASLVAGIYYWPRLERMMRFNPSVSEANFTEPANQLEAQRQDLTYLAEVLDYDRSFSAEARTQFLAMVEQLKSQSEPMSKANFFLQTHRLMALADNAHSSSDTTPVFRNFNRSGIDLYPFADGLFITRAHNSRVELLGRKLVSIEGNAPEELFERLREFSGGPPQARDHFALYLLRSPALLHAAGLIASPDTMQVTLEDSDGVSTTHDLAALPDAAETEFAYRHPYHALLAEPLPDEAGEWVNVLDASNVEPPLSLTDDGQLVLTQSIPGGVYVRSNYLVEYDGHPVRTQLVEALDGAPDGGFERIVVDLRWNPGGDLGNAIPFGKKLGQTLAADGKAYVIVGPRTFSAAIVTAALVKQYGGDRTVIVGEPMGDRAQFWAERGQPFILPNSRYFISYATGYHDWEQGCTDEENEFCYPPSRDEAADIGSLSVDEVIQPTFAQFAAGEDVVMDWILNQ